MPEIVDLWRGDNPADLLQVRHHPHPVLQDRPRLLQIRHQVVRLLMIRPTPQDLVRQKSQNRHTGQVRGNPLTRISLKHVNKFISVPLTSKLVPVLICPFYHDQLNLQHILLRRCLSSSISSTAWKEKSEKMICFYTDGKK